jgi:hypothetical protein
MAHRGGPEGSRCSAADSARGCSGSWPSGLTSRPRFLHGSWFPVYTHQDLDFYAHQDLGFYAHLDLDFYTDPGSQFLRRLIPGFYTDLVPGFYAHLDPGFYTDPGSQFLHRLIPGFYTDLLVWFSFYKLERLLARRPSRTSNPWMVVPS